MEVVVTKPKMPEKENEEQTFERYELPTDDIHEHAAEAKSDAKSQDTAKNSNSDEISKN